MFGFNLDNAVAAWRRGLEQRSALSDQDLDELEAHLRDHVDALVANGNAEAVAFQRATYRLGSFEDVEGEFKKVRFGRVKRHGTVIRIIRRNAAMMRNHGTVSLRSLQRHRSATFINLAGLTFGFACAILILLFVRDELSYDRYHENADRLFRVTFEEAGESASVHRAVTQPALAPTLRDEMPEVVEAARFGLMNDVSLEAAGRDAVEAHFAFADSTFLELFRGELIHGAPDLTRPNTVVLTRTMSETLFGADANPVGRRIRAARPQFESFELEVTGVVEDVPANSHLAWSAVGSWKTFESVNRLIRDDNWYNIGAYTYVLLEHADAAESLSSKLPAFADRHLRAFSEQRRMDLRYRLQPVTDIHLRSRLEKEAQPNGDMAYVRLFAVVGMLILFMACANFINLSTARSIERSREVGIRKVLGGARRQLGMQFLAENVATVAGAGLAGWMLALAGVGLLNELSGKDIRYLLLLEPELVAAIAGIVLTTGVAAGLYPALVLSGFRPALVMKGLDRRGAPGKGFARQALIVTQIAITCGLIAGTAVVIRQIDFVRSKNLGFETEHVVILPNPRSMQERTDVSTVKAELLRHPGIERVSAAMRVPFQQDMMTNGALIPEGSAAEYPVMWDAVDADFVSTLGIDIVKGRNLRADVAGDSAAVLVNEAAVRTFGWTDPIGKRVMSPLSGEPIGTVVGVIGDIHYASFHRPIEAAAYRLGSGRSLRQYVVRIRSERVAETLAYLKQKWSEMAPEHPFDYTFLDESYDDLYRSERRLVDLVGHFAGIAALIAALGLFGLAAYMAQERRKEIGIRKVVGATTAGLVAMLSTDFLKLVLVGGVIAAPVTYAVAAKWLEGFAYHAGIGYGAFGVAILGSLVMAGIAVGYRTYRAASANPVRNLRYE